MSRHNRRPKEIKRCVVCKKRADTQITRNGEPMDYCWKDGFVFACQLNHQKDTAMQLFDKIPDSCYKCQPAELALQNADFMIRGLRQALTEQDVCDPNSHVIGYSEVTEAWGCLVCGDLFQRLDPEASYSDGVVIVAGHSSQ